MDFDNFTNEDLSKFHDAETGLDESKENINRVISIGDEISPAEREEYDGSWVNLVQATDEVVAELISKNYKIDGTQAKVSDKSLSDSISRSSSLDDADMATVINDSDSEASGPTSTFIMDLNKFQELIDTLNINTDFISRQIMGEIDIIRADYIKTIESLRRVKSELTAEIIAEMRTLYERTSRLSDMLYVNNGLLQDIRATADRNFFNQGQKINEIQSGISSLKFRQGLTLVLVLGLIGGVAYAGVELDRLIKTVLAIDNQSQKGCYLFTKDAVPVKLDCSDWYSQAPNNKFYCKCGTLTDTKIQPDCSKLPKEECNSPYCLGKACGGKSADSSITQCRNTYQCTSANRDDPNFINYEYSDNVPLQPLIPYTIVNKVTYDYYNNNMNNNSNKTLMYISIGIGVVALLILIFFTVKYYIKNKKKY